MTKEDVLLMPKRPITLFFQMQRLKKAGIPIKSVAIENLKVFGKEDKRLFAVFTADKWAVELAMHPFNGCNPAFTIWDSKTRGTAKICFLVNLCESRNLYNN